MNSNNIIVHLMFSNRDAVIFQRETPFVNPEDMYHPSPEVFFHLVYDPTVQHVTIKESYAAFNLHKANVSLLKRFSFHHVFVGGKLDQLLHRLYNVTHCY